MSGTESESTPQAAGGLQRLLQWYRDQHKSPEELLEQEILHNWVSTSGAV